MEQHNITRPVEKLAASPSEAPVVFMMCEGDLHSEFPVARTLDNINNLSLLDKTAMENSVVKMEPIMAPLATVACLSMASDNDEEFMNCVFEYDINDKMLHIFESWER